MSTPEVDTKPEPQEPRWLARIAPREVDWATLVVIPVLAVVAAFMVGALLIMATEGVGAVVPAYTALIRGSLFGWNAISETLLIATPLIFAGLAVAIGFRAGLFNIGGEGQITMGGLTAVIIGVSFSGLPMAVHLPLALLGGFIGGALWGFIPGILKARTGAHEVITTIMLNFIAYRSLEYLLKTPWLQAQGRFDPISEMVDPAARLPRILTWLPIENAARLRLNLGFVLALLFAWLVYWLLFKSTIGFEFRTVGANPSAARYGGMAVGTVLVLAMMVSGGLAGLAGANETLGVYGRAFPGFSAEIGFTALALALLGRSHPGGVVLAAFLFGALRVGGRAMQVQTDVGVDLIVVIQALIIVFIAAPELVRAIFRVKGGEGTGQVTKGWGAAE